MTLPRNIFGKGPTVRGPGGGGGFIGARLTMVTDPAVVNGGAIPFDHVAKDEGGFTGGALGTLVIPTAGTYRVASEVVLYNAPAHDYIVDIVRQISGVGGSAVIATAEVDFNAVNTYGLRLVLLADVIDLTAADVLWVYWQGYGAADGYLLGGMAPLANNYFSIQKIG